MVESTTVLVSRTTHFFSTVATATLSADPALSVSPTPFAVPHSFAALSLYVDAVTQRITTLSATWYGFSASEVHYTHHQNENQVDDIHMPSVIYD